MNEPEKCHIEYCGFLNPRTTNELKFELLGLETAIKEAKKRISLLKQTELLVEITIAENSNDNSDSR
jgi:hypothetical protein